MTQAMLSISLFISSHMPQLFILGIDKLQCGLSTCALDVTPSWLISIPVQWVSWVLHVVVSNTLTSCCTLYCSLSQSGIMNWPPNTCVFLIRIRLCSEPSFHTFNMTSCPSYLQSIELCILTPLWPFLPLLVCYIALFCLTRSYLAKDSVKLKANE